MSIIEIIMFVLFAALLAFLIRKKTTKPVIILPVYGLSLAALLYLSFKFGFLWIYDLAYGFMILAGVIITLRVILHHQIKRPIRLSLHIVSAMLLVLSLAVIYVFPIDQVPEPTGDLLIGTQTFEITDETRMEAYDTSNGYRRFMIQIWYPAQTIEGYPRALWLEDGVDIARGLSMDMGFPRFALDQTASILSNSYLGAPMSDQRTTYPVVVISHGWRGFRDLHLDYAEELASRGYVVVSIDHTYGSVATVFDDGSVHYLNPDALPARSDGQVFLDAANQLVNTYAGDVKATLDYLETISQVTSFTSFSSRLDLDHIGLLGHSTGGGGDVRIALEDSRVKALIGLDAWVEPIHDDLITQGLSIPSLFLRSEQWETGVNNDSLSLILENSTVEPLLYQIDGTTHFDFAMVYMYSPLIKMIGFSGEINSQYLTSMLKSMIVGFFDETLYSTANTMWDSAQWPEMHQITSP